MNLISYDSNIFSHKKWTDEESQLLIQEIEKMSVINWKVIATLFKEFSPFECFIQYHNVVKPELNRSSWSAEEEKLLLNLVLKFNEHNWPNIAFELGTKRSPFECLRHYQQALNNKLVNSSDWTPEEDLKLKEAVNICGLANWNRVSSFVKGRTSDQCLNRWRKSDYCQDNIISGPWQHWEERQLFLTAISYEVPSLVSSQKSSVDADSTSSQNPSKKKSIPWSDIQKYIYGKSDVQCREKWVGNLDPTINISPFTQEEDDLLSFLVDKYGEGQWALIAQFTPGRNDYIIRKRWDELMNDKKPSKKPRLLPKKHSRNTVAAISEKEFEPKLNINWEKLENT